mmetsp:Transcript_8267/g.17945  ORF Transcript_8267/g.17945 Transcript_8267/m.17945 type:complete len:204 (+) Transcript_8267:662-1273(+)
MSSSWIGDFFLFNEPLFCELPSPSVSFATSSLAENDNNVLIFFWRSTCISAALFLSSLSSSISFSFCIDFFETLVLPNSNFLSVLLLLSKTLMKPLAMSSVRPLLPFSCSSTSVVFSTRARTRDIATSSDISQRDTERCLNVEFSSSDSKRDSQSSLLIFFRPSSFSTVSDTSSLPSLLISFLTGVLSVGMPLRGSSASMEAI